MPVIRNVTFRAMISEPANAQRDLDTFYSLVGDCISQWAFVDRGLFNLCKTALGTDSTRAAIVFYSSPSVANHLSLVDKLMKYELSGDGFKNKWKPLHKLIERHLNTRSIIAHQPIKPTETSKNHHALYSIHIEPAEQILGKKHKGLGDKQELLAKDLRKHARSLRKVANAVSDFHTFLKHDAKRGP
jgi:hypothetical protein